MDAFKEALKKKLHGKGAKPMVEIEMEFGKPYPDQEHADGQVEGDAITEAKKKEESGLAPELKDFQGQVGEKELAQEAEFNKVAEEEGKEGQVNEAMMQQILSAIGDRGMQGRGPMGLAERAAQGAKGKLAQMKKGYK